jgi:hypothetical protein
VADPSTRYSLLPGAARPDRAPSRAAGAVLTVVLVAWVVVTGVVLVAFAVQRTGMEVACPPHPAYSSYGDAHWGWWPPGISCTYTTTSGVVTHAPTHPSAWSFLFYALPVALGVAAAALGWSWWRAGGARSHDGWWQLDSSGHGVASRYGAVVVPVLRWFYADPRRASSYELDLGFPWRDGAPGGWALRWIEGTGELVGFRWSLAWSNRALRHRHVPGATLEQVQILLVEPDRNVLRDLLADRWEHLDDPHGWHWVLRRVAEARGVGPGWPAGGAGTTTP